MKKIIYIYLILLILLASITLVFAAFPEVKSRTPEPGTSRKEREIYRKHLLENVIRIPLQLPLNNETAVRWKGAWWGCELTLYRDSLVLSSLRRVIRGHMQQSEDIVRAALEAAYTLYPNEFEKEAWTVLEESKSHRNFAIAAQIAIKCSENKNKTRNNLLSTLQKQFPAFETDPILLRLSEELKSQNMQMPSLRDLVFNSKWGENIVIFSFHRKNRNYPGLTIIRNADGNLLRDGKGNIFSVPHLARSVSNLPGYITNGNTPSGILSIVKTGISDNKFIGQSPVIETALPYEIAPDMFFRDSSLVGKSWSRSYIMRLLPESWQNYRPVFESFFAGEAGRSEIIMHGTAIDPEYYKGEPYYPNTPSLGCLTALELYNSNDGKLIKSNQKKLFEAFKKCKIQTGFLVVLDINDRKSPVTLHEIERLLKK